MQPTIKSVPVNSWQSGTGSIASGDGVQSLVGVRDAEVYRGVWVLSDTAGDGNYALWIGIEQGMGVNVGAFARGEKKPVFIPIDNPSKLRVITNEAIGVTYSWFAV